jgi:hypothetical protein
VYLIYVDEAGTSGFTEMDRYVLGAVVVRETEYHTLDRAVNDVKRKHFQVPDPDRVELHVKDLMNNKGPYRALPLEQRLDVFSDTCSVLASANCTLLASVIRKEKVWEGKRPTWDVMEWGHRLLFERACNLLEKVNQARALAGEHPEHGILLFDRVEPRFDAKRRARLVSHYQHGSHYVKNKYLIEEPLFVDGQYRNLSQLADHVAYVLRRKFRPDRRENRMDHLCDQEYARLLPKFDRSATGRVDGYGIKVFP